MYRRFVLTLILSLSVFSPRVSALTLDEATSIAVTHSSELKRARLESDSAQWEKLKAFSGFMPHIDVSGRHLFNERFEEIPIDFGGSHFEMPAIQPYTVLSLNATLELFNGFGTVNELRAAKAASEASEHKVSRAEEKIKTETRTLYYRALGSQFLVDVAEQSIQTLEGHLEDVRARVRSGVSTRFDSLRSEVQLEDARTEKLAAENEVVLSRARLFEALGVPDDGKPLAGGLPIDFTKYENLKVSADTIHREDRVAAALSVEEVRDKSKAARSHWLPAVSLFGSESWYNAYNHSITGDEAHYKPASAFGVLLNWNLFDGGAKYASQRQAAIAEQIANERLAEFDRAAPIELEESERRLKFDLVNYRAKLSSVRKAEEAVRLARGGVRAGTRTNTEVLDAVVDLNRAKAATLKAQIDAVDALGKLELALGRSL